MDLSLQNFIKAIIGKTMSFVNWVASKLIIVTEGMSVGTIKLLYHATIAQMKKHYRKKPTIKTAAVLLCSQQNANSALTGPVEVIANRVVLRKEMVMTMIIVVFQRRHQLKHQQTS